MFFAVVQVIHNVGLCIALWDIMKMDDSYIFPLDGSSHTVGVWLLFMQDILEASNIAEQWFVSHWPSV